MQTKQVFISELPSTALIFCSITQWLMCHLRPRFSTEYPPFPWNNQSGPTIDILH